MTAFLFLPGTDAGMARRVDLQRFASLFAESEEPIAARGGGLLLARALAMLLVLLLVLGDTVLLARPEALTRAPGCAAAPSAAPVTSL